MKYHCEYSKLSPIADIVPNPQNPNTHPDEQIELLAQIIEFQGWRAPIVVSKRSGFVVRGHGRLLAAQKLNLKKVPIDEQPYESEAQEWADLIADNRIAELAEMDRSTLKDLIEKLDTGDINLDLTGFDQASLEDLMSEFFVPEEGLTPEDDIPDDVKSRVKSGDLWQLGSHRLICGDSLIEKTYEVLLRDTRTNISFTSPPYNVGGNTMGGHLKSSEEHSKYITGNDKVKDSDYVELLNSAVRQTLEYSEFSFVNLQMLGANKVTIIEWLQNWKHHFADVAIWNKTHGAPAMGESVLNAAFEFIWIFGKKLNPTRRIHTGKFRGNIQNVYTGGKQTGNEYSKVHGATFPVHLPEWILASFTKANDSCLDVFGGTGSTMIACEKMNRSCYMAEIGETYCDIILQRWENFTGKKAKKVKK